MDATTIKTRIEESGVPLRELGSLSGINYQKICDWKKGWAELKDPELIAVENALNAAIRSRVDKFTRLATDWMVSATVSAPA